MTIFEEWVLPDAPDGTAVEGITCPSLASLVRRRAGASDLRSFLRPTVDDLHDASLIHGMDAACDRISAAISNREHILIYGDYDVDGVTSIVLLRYAISALGGSVAHVVPHRLVDGYGLKMEVLERVLIERDVKLVITVDCGITSVAPVEAAIERGIDVIITDHHLPPGALPRAIAVLNPKQEGCEYPFKELAGVGVAFKLACELLRRAGRKVPLESLLKIAAIGTVADVAPLTGENRTIARVGLAALRHVTNPGLRVMLRTLGFSGKGLRAADVGFRIGPRINAAGRLASADTAIDLFSCSSEAEAEDLMGQLEALNGERRAVEQSVLTEAERLVADAGPRNGYVVTGREWHRGVLGLCAARIAQKMHRPVLAISVGDEEAVGSARSVTGVDLHALLSRISDVFTHFGGHEYACGFTLPVAKLDKLIEAFGREAERISPDLLRRRAMLDGTLVFSELTPRFLDELMLLEPFGAANPRPVFQTLPVRVESRKEFSPGCFNLVLEHEGERRTGVLWRSNAALEPALVEGASVAIAYAVEPDRWGRLGMQLDLLDARAL